MMPPMPIASVRASVCAISPSGCYVDTGHRSAFGRTNDDPNMLTEYRERLHQALERDAAELIVSDRRNLGLRHAQYLRGSGLGQTLCFEQSIQFHRKHRLHR